MIYEIENYLNDLLASVEDGEVSALATFAQISDISRLVNDVMEKVKNVAIAEAEAWQEASFTEYGRKFTKVPPRRMVKYDGVPQWQDLTARRKRIEELALVAATKFGATIVDDETGEIIPPAEISYSKPSISVK